MLFTLIKIQLLLASLLVLGQTGSAAAQDLTRVGMDANGKEVSVRVGGILEVRLEAQGGTGYSWYPDDLDFRRLELISEKTESPPRDGMVEQPVFMVWRFKAR